MYGDFEAQRHWMELTVHRPTSEWYTYAPEWWLLDCRWGRTDPRVQLMDGKIHL